PRDAGPYRPGKPTVPTCGSHDWSPLPGGGFLARRIPESIAKCRDLQPIPTRSADDTTSPDESLQQRLDTGRMVEGILLYPPVCRKAGLNVCRAAECRKPGFAQVSPEGRREPAHVPSGQLARL